MSEYFQLTPDPDRGFALAAITRELKLKNLKPARLRSIVENQVDPELFKISYDYVGDMAETISLIWPKNNKNFNHNKLLPNVGDFITTLESLSKSEVDGYITKLLSTASPNERWAIIKLATGGLRVGVSARLAKAALAKYSGQELSEIEKIWHGLDIPYTKLFKWLDGLGSKPKISIEQTFHPMMLSNPINIEKDFKRFDSALYDAEWKWDGIRVQLVFSDRIKPASKKDKSQVVKTARIYSRTGDDISAAFPDVTESLQGRAVLDGELLIGTHLQTNSTSEGNGDFLIEIKREPQSFNHLQQRLNRKKPSSKLIKELPAFIRVYDMLFNGKNDIREQPLYKRRMLLKKFLMKHKNPRLDFSETIEFENWETLTELRKVGTNLGHEGLMLKNRESLYIAGRPKGPWFKWKRDPRVIDTIMMYAQRGHGRRSSFYSDFTFGIWNSNNIVAIGKAYSGFTEDEMRELDKWVRSNTINRFGPVREVEKKLVVELAFDSIHENRRRKSGVALRFPRVNRIRWDKPPAEADTIDGVKALIT